MKKYRLLKDLPSLKAGSIFSKDFGKPDYRNGGYYFMEDEIKDPEWFEEIGDGCNHVNVTDMSGAYFLCDDCGFVWASINTEYGA